MSDIAIQKGAKVTLHFSLALENGEVIDSNFDAQPASFLLGDGNMLEGFEQCLLGMTAGQENSFLVPPEQAFGDVNQGNVHSFPRSKFADHQELVEGLVLSFADPGKGERPGVIKTLRQDTVVVDFNHPLAGQSIVFKVRVLSVAEPDDPIIVTSIN